jgi:transcriptional regulator with XRE-family HTH domain
MVAGDVPERRGSALVKRLGARLRHLRKQQGLSQSQIRAATGLMLGHISRLENGRTAPTLETLERYSRALKVPVYTLFYTPHPGGKTHGGGAEEAPGTPEEAFINEMRELLPYLSSPDRDTLLTIAERLAKG